MVPPPRRDDGRAPDVSVWPNTTFGATAGFQTPQRCAASAGPPMGCRPSHPPFSDRDSGTASRDTPWRDHHPPPSTASWRSSGSHVLSTLVAQPHSSLIPPAGRVLFHASQVDTRRGPLGGMYLSILRNRSLIHQEFASDLQSSILSAMRSALARLSRPSKMTRSSLSARRYTPDVRALSVDSASDRVVQ